MRFSTNSVWENRRQMSEGIQDVVALCEITERGLKQDKTSVLE